jgi:dinuclear metal center YbgI/SA1388 family protein
MLLNELADYIASLLETGRFRDYSPNGIQVEGRTEVRKIASGVTASQYVLEQAIAWGADALLVHHGYFWRSENATITGIKKRRIAHLLQHDLSLLAYHLPLDAHAELGNNARLGKLLGFAEQGRFGEQDLAMHGVLVQPQTLAQLSRQIEDKLERKPQVIGMPEKAIRRIAWCSGGAQSYFDLAVTLGVDAFLTGRRPAWRSLQRDTMPPNAMASRRLANMCRSDSAWNTVSLTRTFRYRNKCRSMRAKTQNADSEGEL